MSNKQTVAIIGAGASGCFCAVNLCKMSNNYDVTIFEAHSKPLAKVAITGGGRCNITNSFAQVNNFAEVYPRGEKLLKKLFYTFNQNDTLNWFESEGVEFVTQDDNCVFPKSQNAMQIVDTLLDNINKYHINLLLDHKLINIEKIDNKFLLSFNNNAKKEFDIVLVATGGANPEFLNIFENLGLNIVPTVPSLFTFTIKNQTFNDLMGVVIEDVSCSIASTKFKSNGPLLITHWGVSGPAILKLSSYSAKYLKENKYTSNLIINWLNINEDETRKIIQDLQHKNPKRQVLSIHPPKITSRLWQYFLLKCEIDNSKRWDEISKKSINKLVSTLVSDTYKIQGRGHYKEEFVTCGGISLSNINSNTLESKKIENLYFAGEVLDIDAITGGFNLQAAWTTGFVVAKSIVSKFS
ncbi:MAG: NAD(P)/FAD-dependent oxidoreductase [Bacteroidales bacterium]|nr:NAD(P)/FAD-dependent oxidoreductase [Bacteroidales bacterium]